MTRLVVGATTDVGQVRDHNEDGYLVQDDIGLVALADGMGGHQAGEVASATALEALQAAMRDGRSIREAIEAANVAVYEQAQGDQQLQGMGTTLTAATLSDDGTLLFGHVGDSRAYLLRDGALERVTTDHSVIEELVQAGDLTEEQARVDPRRSMITRAIGLDSAVDVDLYPIPLQAGDRFMFCSDGLTDMVDDVTIEQALAEDSEPAAAAQRLVELANAAGGTDNITVVVVDVAEVTEGLVAPVPPGDVPDDVIEHEQDETMPVPPVSADDGPTRRRTVFRVLKWVAPIVLLLAIALGIVAWYTRTHYYVGSSLRLVAVYKGVPGGILFFDPTLEDRTSGLRLVDLTATQREEVLDGKTFSSKEDAIDYVDKLCRQARERRPRTSCRPSGSKPPPSTTSTTSTTTTTLPPTTAATVPPTITPPLT